MTTDILTVTLTARSVEFFRTHLRLSQLFTVVGSSVTGARADWTSLPVSRWLSGLGQRQEMVTRKRIAAALRN